MIRYPVTFNYLLILLDNLSEKYEFQVMKDKACVANIVYKVCENDRMSQYEFDGFVRVIKEQHISEKIFNEVGDDVLKLGIHRLVNIIQKNIATVEKQLAKLVDEND